MRAEGRSRENNHADVKKRRATGWEKRKEKQGSLEVEMAGEREGAEGEECAGSAEPCRDIV